MAIPKITDLILYINKKITGADWNSNWQKIITWLTGGTTDIKVNSIDTNSVTTSGTITSNGATINGNAEISGDLQVGGVISGDGSGLTGITSVSAIAWTPFCVNKGYIDTTTTSPTYGKEIPMYKESGYDNLIKFNAPITATTSDGVNFILDVLDDLDVSNTGNGTYIVCIKKDQQRAELKEGANGVYRQRLAPTDVSIPNNSLWLDTSTENIQCYEKLNNDWTTKYDGVPVGEVVVSGGEVSSLKVYRYNWNGYNVNVADDENIFQVAGVIMRTWQSDNIDYDVTHQQTSTDYTIEYSNGFVVQGGKVFFPASDNNTKVLPLKIAISKFYSVTSNGLYNNVQGYGSCVCYFVSFSGGDVTVKGTNGNQQIGCCMWEVKGFK